MTSSLGISMTDGLALLLYNANTCHTIWTTEFPFPIETIPHLNTLSPPPLRQNLTFSWPQHPLPFFLSPTRSVRNSSPMSSPPFIPSPSAAGSLKVAHCHADKDAENNLAVTDIFSSGPRLFYTSNIIHMSSLSIPWFLTHTISPPINPSSPTYQHYQPSRFPTTKTVHNTPIVSHRSRPRQHVRNQ